MIYRGEIVEQGVPIKSLGARGIRIRRSFYLPRRYLTAIASRNVVTTASDSQHKAQDADTTVAG